MKDKVCIIGISCRFPQARNYQEYWDNLINGKDCITEIPDERWDKQEFYTKNRRESQKSISKWCGVVEDATSFDHEFFGISAREALYMDPQQRISLEEAWHCMEDSGVSLQTLQKVKTSVYMGVMSTDYQHILNLKDIDVDAFHGIGNYECILANRISYSLGLNGSSQSINAACASSVVAMHEAKKSLLLGESDYAFAGGVNLNLSPWKYISFSKAGMLSQQGRCRTFDRSADGYVPGDGVGIVLLARLEDAIKNGNKIYGVIAGSAVNHTGSGRGISAPKIDAQKTVIKEALNEAKITSSEIAYVEAHGTGTSLGDPIEIEALKQIYQETAITNESCPIGSVKTNIGHLESAAGIAGVIKVIMMFKHKKIPPLLHIKIPNPIINFKETPFRLVQELETLKSKSDRGFVSGISSFGFGGTNSHIVLESYNEENQSHIKKETKDLTFKKNVIVALSGVNENQIEIQKNNLKEHWNLYKEEFKNQSEELILNRISKTLLSRKPMRYRSSAVISSLEEYEGFLFTKEHIKDSRKEGFHLHISDCIEEDEKSEYFFNLYKSLSEYGLKIDGISSTGSGNRMAGVLSGMIKQSDIEDLLSNKNPEKQDVNLPKIPVWNNKNEKWILPIIINEEYLIHLTKNIDQNINVARSYIDKSRLLFDHQYTFKNYLTEWDKAIREKKIIDTSIEELLKNDDLLFSINKREKKTLLLLIIVLAGSLERLNKKWSLKSELITEDDCFHEFIDLIVDQVINYSSVIDLIFNERADLKRIAQTMQLNHQKVDAKKKYNLLKTYSKNSIEDEQGHINFLGINDSKNNKQAKVISEAIGVEEKKTIIQFGGNASFFPKNEVIVVSDHKKKECLLTICSKLFMAGMQIENDSLFNNEHIQTLSLPGYPFKKVKHWARKEKIDHQIVSEKIIEDQNSIEKQPTNNKEAKGDILKNKTIDLYQEIKRFFEELFTKELKIAQESIDVTCNISDYGIDSVVSGIMIAELQKTIPNVPQVLFLEHQTLEEVIRYLVTHFSEDFLTYLNQKDVQNQPLELSEYPRTLSFDSKSENKEKNNLQIVSKNQLRKNIEKTITQLLIQELNIEEKDVDITSDVSDYGIDSILSGIMIAELRKSVPDIPQILFLENRTFEEVVDYLEKNFSEYFSESQSTEVLEEPENELAHSKSTLTTKAINTVQEREEGNLDIAIIGVSGMLPKSENVLEFSKLLENREVMTENIPKKRLELLGVENKEYEKIKNFYGGFIPDIENFDFQKFNFSEEEAIQIDPQLRKLIENVWSSISDSGYTTKEFQKKETGVFVATRGNSGYIDIMKLVDRDYEIEFPGLYANRISQVFNLKGPSEIVDTGCSSFIAAIEKAYHAFLRKDCYQAVVATATLNLSFHELNKKDITGIYSQQNSTKSFSKDSDGFVRSETIGSLIIKPLSDAEKDGDHIYGVIKGVAAFHGGKSPLKWNSPNIKGQKKSIEKAIQRSKINPLTIDYIETEANGTSFVDSSEIVSIQSVYGGYFNKFPDQFTNKKIYIGSLKPLVGHAETSSTFSCLMKLIISTHKKKIFGVKGLTTLNESIQLQEHFVIPKEDESWKSSKDNVPKRTAINCLGLGGVNTHMIFEEYIGKNISMCPNNQDNYIIIFSDETEKQLVSTIQRYIEYLPTLRTKFSEEEILVRLEYTLRVGRDALSHRLLIKSDNFKDLIHSLEAWVKTKELQSNNYKYIYNFGVIKKISQESIKKAFQEKDEISLVEFWVQGGTIKWNDFYEDRQTKRISLPPTTLKKIYCWPFHVTSKNKIIDTPPKNNKVSSGSSNEEHVNIDSDKKPELITFSLGWRKEQKVRLNYDNSHIEHHHIVCYGIDISSLSNEYEQDGIVIKYIEEIGLEQNQLFEELSVQLLTYIKKILLKKPRYTVCVQIIIPIKLQEIAAGISGLVHTCRKESTKVKPQLIFVEDSTKPKELMKLAKENKSFVSDDSVIKYLDNERYVQRREVLDVINDEVNHREIYNNKDVILITGGLGGLGMLLAEDICNNTERVKIFLTGRSKISPEKETRLKALNKGTTEIVYRQSDISDKNSILNLINAIKKEQGNITGIYHVAGLLRDNYIIKKTEEELREVFKPKVTGTTYLDEVTKNEQLRFFVCFSSLHVLGNVGQSDYAMANAYMDAFVGVRNKLVNEGKRQGKTITINWPYWKDGGMRIPESTIDYMLNYNGASPLPTKVGFKMLHNMIQSSREQIIIDFGNKEKIAQYHNIQEIDTSVIF